MNKPATLQGTISRLYPSPGEEAGLQGLYLDHLLHTRGGDGRPYVYSNFITTLDGRIAIATEGRTSHEVPEHTVNARDWRLYQELAAQADLLVTSGRFLRQSLVGEAQDYLPVGTGEEFDDLHAWRRHHGLSPQPDVAVLSSSLALPIAAFEPYRDRRLLVFTGADAPQDKVDALTRNGIEVIRAGPGRLVEGHAMIAELGRRKYRSIYAIAGPEVFSTLVEAGALDRLYLTITHQLLSGEEIDTMTRGPSLAPPYGMHLVSLYQDTHAPAGAGQWFCIFEPQ
jgi:riboflavin biosynthesis pyrimidine reductase